jgi:hypothetical protein
MKMKKMIFLMLLSFLGITASMNAQVAIGTGTGVDGAPAAGAVLELDGTKGALLLPKVDALATITSPAAGMLVYLQSDNQVYIYDGDSWNVYTGAEGPAGAKGDTGAQGPIGLTGPAGSNGAKGDKGDTGTQGPIGLTGPAGSNGAKGDKGDKGDTGNTGATGPAGPAGPSSGTLHRLSASCNSQGVTSCTASLNANCNVNNAWVTTNLYILGSVVHRYAISGDPGILTVTNYDTSTWTTTTNAGGLAGETVYYLCIY